MGEETKHDLLSPLALGNWVPVRRGLLEHIQKDKMTTKEFAAYMVILLNADKATGCWWGCSVALAAFFGDAGITPLSAQRVIRSLANKGYIKQLRQQGSRGNYPIVVDKYLVTVGKLKDQYVNAAATTDSKNPAVYENGDPGGEAGDDRGGVAYGDPGGVEVTPYSIPQHSNTPIPQQKIDSSPIESDARVRTEQENLSEFLKGSEEL